MAFLNFATTSSNGSLLAPPAALKCPPPLKYLRANVFIKPPLLRKNRFPVDNCTRSCSFNGRKINQPFRIACFFVLNQILRYGD